MATVNDTIALAARYFQAGQADRAADELLRSLRLHPDHADLHHELGVVYLQTRQTDRAIYHLQRGASLAPKRPDIQVNYAAALNMNGRPAESIEPYRKAVAADPRSFPGWVGLSSALVGTHEYAGAVEAARKAVAIDPRRGEGHVNLATALARLGKTKEAVAALEEALMRIGDHPLPLTALANTLITRPEATAASVREINERLGRSMNRYAPSFTPVFPDTTPGRKLRIGYYGTDLRDHAVAHFLMPVLKAHDRSRFQVFVYSAAPAADSVTQTLGNAADGFRDVAGFSDNAISQAVRADRVDILVDVSGHNPGGRSGAILHRPAPVVIGWLGYPATTGMRGVRYRITDSRLDPEGSEANWTETLVRVDAPSIVYGPPPGPAVQPGAKGAGEGVTFVSLAPTTRINEAVLDAWAAILKGTPGSRLLLKAAGFSGTSTRESFIANFAERGVEASRLAFAGYDRGRNDYLRVVASADIGLDTFPANGMASTCDALSVGVPVVTLAGAAHAGRLGMAILTGAGCEALVASSVEDYVKIATGLAKDAQRLARYRAELPRQLTQSALCDAASLTKRLEAAYERLWAEAASGVYYAAPEGGIQPDIPPTAMAERSAPVAPELPTINASDLV